VATTDVVEIAIMRKSEARLLISSIARAVRERFARKTDHDDLAARVAQLEAMLAELKKSWKPS
jgi:hypothetical protein